MSTRDCHDLSLTLKDFDHRWGAVMQLYLAALCFSISMILSGRIQTWISSSRMVTVLMSLFGIWWTMKGILM